MVNKFLNSSQATMWQYIYNFKLKFDHWKMFSMIVINIIIVMGTNIKHDHMMNGVHSHGFLSFVIHS
jgi:hypothetical protein